MSVLEMLPPEIILCITDFLEKPDIVCLSLCSHFLLNVNGIPVLPTRDLKRALLTRIVVELPHMFYCHYCVKLHPIADVSHPSLTADVHNNCPGIGLLRRSNFADSLWIFFNVHGMTSLYHFRHSHLVASMKNHYHGQTHGITAESLAYTEVMHWRFRPTVTTLLSVEGHVCSLDRDGPTLVLQVQNWVLFHDKPDTDTIMSTFSHILVCQHEKLGHNAQRFYTRFATENRGPCLEKDDTVQYRRCARCRVEFQFAFRDCGADGTAIVVTKWLDLGAGFKLDINDPKWTLIKAYEVDGIEKCGGRFAASWRLFHGISSFQGQVGHSTDRNQAYYLEGKQYRRLMYPRLGGVYWSLIS